MSTDDDHETDAEFAAKVEANDSQAAKRIDELERENAKLRTELASAIEAKEYWMRQR